jgi:hypothetical protein
VCWLDHQGPSSTGAPHWLQYCAALTSVHVEHLKSVKAVDCYWLDDCTALTSVHIEGEMDQGLKEECEERRRREKATW